MVLDLEFELYGIFEEYSTVCGGDPRVMAKEALKICRVRKRAKKRQEPKKRLFIRKEKS